MHETEKLAEDIQAIVERVVETGVIGTPVGMPVGWVLLINEQDPIRHHSYTSAICKEGQSTALALGMLGEVKARMEYAAAMGIVGMDDSEDDSI